MNGIPDAPWIRYADTNGDPYGGCDEYKSRYRVETEEADGSTEIETFDDCDEALDFYNQCVADGVNSVDCWSIGSDGELIDLIACYEKEDENE